MSDRRRLHLTQVLYVPGLANNLMSVSHLAKKGIMTSFTKTRCALIDSDDGNFLLAEASITPGGLYAITKAVCCASLAALALSATAASSSSKGMAPLPKDMQKIWHVLCAAKDETSVDIMGRMFCCNFLRKSRL
jgi:hypothetical protein